MWQTFNARYSIFRPFLLCDLSTAVIALDVPDPQDCAPMQAELETSRGKTMLYDSMSARISLQPSGKHSFIIKHDVKEVGNHTLICHVSYTTVDGERRTLQQYFKFSSANPLSVRTKVASLPVLQILYVTWSACACHVIAVPQCMA